MRKQKSVPATDITDRSLDGYEEFAASVSFPGNEVIPLFTTDANGLWDAYINNIPEYARQHYNCRTCSDFIERYGGLVYIASDGTSVPAFWEIESSPEFFRPAVTQIKKLLRNAKVNGVFVSDKETLGIPTTHDHKGRPDWGHLAINLPREMVWNSRVMNASQRMAEYQQEHHMLVNALRLYSRDTVRSALQLLNAESLYRSEKVLGVAQWFDSVQEKMSKTTLKNNWLWYFTATAPTGFCHIKSTMIGTLLDDIDSGMSFQQVAARFAEKMAPTQYQRAQVAPAQGAIDQAEKLFAQMELGPALNRRYAQIDELPEQAFIWAPSHDQVQQSSGIFSHLRARGNEQAPVSLEIPPRLITWEKFANSIMPNATSLDVLVPRDASRFMALVTEAEPAPAILQWDNDNESNPFSWYYAAGIDAEIRRRVLNAGGRYANNDIRASLAWSNRNDLDLHVISPDGHIFYGNKKARDGYGWLDVDMNVDGETMEPIENTRWPAGTAPQGRYQVLVNLYRTHGFKVETPFRVELELFGQLFMYDGITRTSNSGNVINAMVRVADFVYMYGQNININLPLATTSSNDWNMVPDTWAPVTAIVTSPNTWTVNMPQFGEHAFFLLDKCQDLSDGVGRGFFTEMLKSDLRPVRSVLEAYVAEAKIKSVPAPACGIGISKDGVGDMIIRATGNNVTGLYKIDRWD